MKYCRNCGAYVEGKIYCPQCGCDVRDKVVPAKKKKNPIVVILSVILIVFGVMILMSGIGGMLSTSDSSDGNVADNDSQNVSSSSQEAGNNESDAVIVDKFEIMDDFTTVRDEVGLLYITGSVKNLKGRDLSYAQITFNLYDADGAQIGTALDNINDLEEDGLWKFKALVFDDSAVASYKLTGIDSF